MTHFAGLSLHSKDDETRLVVKAVLMLRIFAARVVS